MQIIEIDKKATILLEEWDPFEEGTRAYEVEISAIIAALHYLDDPVDLAKRIREVYERSYGLWIPIEKCVQISYKLLAIKFEAKCIV